MVGKPLHTPCFLDQKKWDISWLTAKNDYIRFKKITLNIASLFMISEEIAVWAYLHIHLTILQGYGLGHNSLCYHVLKGNYPNKFLSKSKTSAFRTTVGCGAKNPVGGSV